MNADKPFLTATTSDQLAMELAALRRRIEQLEGREQSVSQSGTWVPTLFGATTAGTFTYASTGAQWSRQGDRITINGRVLTIGASVAPAGAMLIGGLPVVPAPGTTNGNILGGVTIIWSTFPLAANYTAVSGGIVGSTSNIYLYKSGMNVARAFLAHTDLPASWAVDLFFWGMYKVD